MGIGSIGWFVTSAARSARDEILARSPEPAQNLVTTARARTETSVVEPVEAAMTAIRDAATPVAQGAALRALDIAVGVRGRGTAQLTNDSRDGRVSDHRDGARTSGRGSVRPAPGDGPALPAKVNNGGNMPGFPTPPAAPKGGDGSKPHRSESASLKDHLVEDLCYRMADAADAAGLNNAARNLRHYLGNSGAPLAFDPNKLLSDIPAIKTQIDASYQKQVVDPAKAKVAADYTGKPIQFTITTPWNGAYATQSASTDWFFATGGFSYAHTATVTVTPGKDGKAMGRLHEAGLAREYELRGSGKGPSSDFTMTP